MFFAKKFIFPKRIGHYFKPWFTAFSGGDSGPFWGVAGTYTGSDPNDAEALITRYDIEQIPIIPTFRVGFILNY